MFRPGDVDVVPAVGLDEFESPDSLLKGGPIRERVLDIVTGLRTPTEVDDFSIHYSEQYQTGNSWEFRWDRHSNDHNTRKHFHSLPDAPTPGDDADHPDEGRDVLATILTPHDERIEAFWNK